MGSKLEVCSSLTNQDDYSFSLSNQRNGGNYVVSIGQVFAMLLPKDRVSSKYRGYELEIPSDIEGDD